MPDMTTLVLRGTMRNQADDDVIMIAQHGDVRQDVDIANARPSIAQLVGGNHCTSKCGGRSRN